MTLTIKLSEQQASALAAKAAAEGLSIEEWILKIAQPEPTAVEPPLQTAADIILASMRDVPPEIMATLPNDAASQHDHYLYRWPKKAE